MLIFHFDRWALYNNSKTNYSLLKSDSSEFLMLLDDGMSGIFTLCKGSYRLMPVACAHVFLTWYWLVTKTVAEDKHFDHYFQTVINHSMIVLTI